VTTLAASVQTIPTPHVAYHAIAPILIVTGAALVGLLVEALFPRAQRFVAQMVVTILGLGAALVAVALLHGTEVTTPLPGTGSSKTFAGAVAIDGTGLFLQGTVLALAIVATLLIAERTIESSPIVASAAIVVGSPEDQRLSRTERVQTEVFPLLLFAVSGMLIFPVSNNLIVMFVALEILSLPLYLMAGLARRRRLLSQEASLKYFLLGAFSSAFFLYGLALIYGYSDSVDLTAILNSSRTSGRPDILLYLGFALLLCGLLFKASVAPFHNWTPDVYQGAPTPVAGFMAACTKVAAFGALLRVLFFAFSGQNWNWRPVIWTVAIASMVVGAIWGVTQTDVKRVFAYSSIAHAGFILVALVAITPQSSASVLFYVLTYGFTTIAAFGLLTLVRDADGEATRLSQWSGLARKSPGLAALMTLMLLSMAGIPLTSGFMGKFEVFSAAWHTAGPLVVIALLFSAVAAFYYLRIVVMMYFAEPPENGPTVAIPGWATAAALTVAVVVTIGLGVYPQPLLDLASHAANSFTG
jgi:NADH-quinone oxidoreductase subunit N